MDQSSTDTTNSDQTNQTASTNLKHHFDFAGTFLGELGLEVVSFHDGKSELRLETHVKHENIWGVVHGGVVMTLLDVAMALAGRSLDPNAEGNVTVEMKTSFMRPARGPLKAVGSCTHRSTTLAFCDGEIYGGDGQLVAKAMGTFKYIRATDIKRLGMRAGRKIIPGGAGDGL